jgi:hypothetical protein
MKSFFLLLLLVLSLNTTISAQSMNVDMNPSVAGIQDTMKSTIVNEQFIVEFIGSNLTNVSAYQFKIVFDSTRFIFLGGAADYGFSGKKNILSGNGGALTGIFQKQANPPCDSILDVAYTINGTTNLSISGTGLIGIAQFQSKLKSGESGAIKITEGYMVDFNGIKTPVTTYTGGTYQYKPSVATARSFGEKLQTYNISCSRNIIHFDLPFTNGLDNGNVEIVLYDLKGRFEANVFNGFLLAGHHDVSLEKADGKIIQGFHVCALHYGSETKTLKMFVGK